MRKPRFNLTRQQTILVGAAAIILLGIAWYLFRPELLFVNQTVNEPPPASMAAGQVPDSTPVASASGMFHKVAHDTKGTASVYELSGGQKFVRLTGFETSNGPDVHVYLVAAPDATDNSTVTQAGFLDLGSLKGNIGDQNYDIPEGTDVAKYHAVTIWCKRFSVNFGTAPLSDNKMSDNKMSDSKMSDSNMSDSNMSDRKMADDKMAEPKMGKGRMMTDNKMSVNKMGDRKMTNNNTMSAEKVPEGKMTRGTMGEGKM
jgi:hypothetical protein